jgi:hypothetical protein
VLDLSGLPEADPLDGYHVIRPSLQLPNGKPFTHPYAFEPQDITVTFTSDTCTGAGGAGGSGSGESDANGGAAADAKASGGAPGAP